MPLQSLFCTKRLSLFSSPLVVPPHSKFFRPLSTASSTIPARRENSGGFLCSLVERFSYKRLPSSVVVRVFKLGTLCRTMWPVFVPLTFYKYLREVDREMYLSELFYERSGSTKPHEFYDGSQPGWLGHWRIMADLKSIYHDANPGRVKTYADGDPDASAEED